MPPSLLVHLSDAGMAVLIYVTTHYDHIDWRHPSLQLYAKERRFKEGYGGVGPPPNATVKRRIALRNAVLIYRLEMKEGRLYSDGKEVIELSRIQGVLEQEHSESPTGMDKMFAQIRDKYLGVTRQDIRLYVGHCKIKGKQFQSINNHEPQVGRELGPEGELGTSARELGLVGQPGTSEQTQNREANKLSHKKSNKAVFETLISDRAEMLRAYYEADISGCHEAEETQAAVYEVDIRDVDVSVMRPEWSDIDGSVTRPEWSDIDGSVMWSDGGVMRPEWSDIDGSVMRPEWSDMDGSVMRPDGSLMRPEFSQRERLLLLRAYEEHPDRWDDVVVTIRENLSALPVHTQMYYYTREVRGRLIQELRRLMSLTERQLLREDQLIRDQITAIKSLQTHTQLENSPLTPMNPQQPNTKRVEGASTEQQQQEGASHKQGLRGNRVLRRMSHLSAADVAAYTYMTSHYDCIDWWHPSLVMYAEERGFVGGFGADKPLSNVFSKRRAAIRNTVRQLQVKAGKLYSDGKEVVDFSRIQEVLELEHGDSHPGMGKMFAQIRQKYAGVKRADVRQYTAACEVCHIMRQPWRGQTDRQEAMDSAQPDEVRPECCNEAAQESMQHAQIRDHLKADKMLESDKLRLEEIDKIMAEHQLKSRKKQNGQKTTVSKKKRRKTTTAKRLQHKLNENKAVEENGSNLNINVKTVKVKVEFANDSEYTASKCTALKTGEFSPPPQKQLKTFIDNVQPATRIVLPAAGNVLPAARNVLPVMKPCALEGSESSSEYSLPLKKKQFKKRRAKKRSAAQVEGENYSAYLKFMKKLPQILQVLDIPDSGSDSE